MKNALNAELTSFLGVKGNWVGIITASVSKRCSSFKKNGLFDDLLTDVISKIILGADKLAPAIARAKESSSTEQELLMKLCRVLSVAAAYRAQDVMKLHYTTTVPFSQLTEKDVDCFLNITAKPEDEFGTPDYIKLLIDELESKAVEIEKDQLRLAKRLRVAQKVVVDRVQGKMPLLQLARKYDLPKSTMQAIFYDMQDALHRLAKRLDDPTLKMRAKKQRK